MDIFTQNKRLNFDFQIIRRLELTDITRMASPHMYIHLLPPTTFLRNYVDSNHNAFVHNVQCTLVYTYTATM